MRAGTSETEEKKPDKLPKTLIPFLLAAQGVTLATRSELHASHCNLKPAPHLYRLFTLVSCLKHPWHMISCHPCDNTAAISFTI